MPLNTTPTEPAIIDRDYCESIEAAANLHNPVKPMARRIADVLFAAGNLDIRRPNDWEFQFNGVAVFRWYDGPGSSFSGSTRSMSMAIHSDSLNLDGRMSARKHSYNESNRVNIDGMGDADALAVLRILVKIIDGPLTKGEDDDL